MNWSGFRWNSQLSPANCIFADSLPGKNKAKSKSRIWVTEWVQWIDRITLLYPNSLLFPNMGKVEKGKTVDEMSPAVRFRPAKALRKIQAVTNRLSCYRQQGLCTAVSEAEYRSWSVIYWSSSLVQTGVPPEQTDSPLWSLKRIAEPLLFRQSRFERNREDGKWFWRWSESNGIRCSGFPDTWRNYTIE